MSLIKYKLSDTKEEGPVTLGQPSSMLTDILMLHPLEVDAMWVYLKFSYYLLVKHPVMMLINHLQHQKPMGSWALQMELETLILNNLTDFTLKFAAIDVISHTFLILYF